MTVDARKPARAAESSRKHESLLATRIAEMHYNEGLSNLAIAERLGISRFRVARMLDVALATGIVTITVQAPVAIDSDLSRQVRERYHLAEALVVPAEAGATTSLARAAVGAVAAQFVAELLNDGAKVGIAWGKTLAEFAVASRQYRFPKCDAVQLLGNLPTLEGSMHAGDVLRMFAESLGGSVYPLHAPLILPDESTAQGVKREASVRQTLAMYGELDVAILGVGSWNPPSSHLFEVLPEADRQRLLALNPTADICANIFDDKGTLIQGEFSSRAIGITADETLKVPMSIVITAGAEKASALRAVLNAGLPKAIVTDAATAQGLLAR